MNDHNHLPNIDRISVIIALILLAYAVTAFISFPTQTLNLQLPGFLLVINLNFITIVSVVVAILAAAGTDLLISVHPHLPEGQRWQHWLVPAFTASAISVPLGSLEVSPSWWVVFALGGLLLTGVFIAEYISVDNADTRYSLAALGLNAVSFALFLILISAIIGAGLRLYILMAAIVPTVFLITARSLFLRLGGSWKLGWAAGITLIMAQLAASLFYLPLLPIQYSLILLGIFYGLVSVASNIEEKQSTQTLWIEPVLMAVVFISLSFLLR